MLVRIYCFIFFVFIPNFEIKRNKPSGATFRTLRKHREIETAKLSGTLNAFLVPSSLFLATQSDPNLLAPTTAPPLPPPDSLAAPPSDSIAPPLLPVENVIGIASTSGSGTSVPVTAVGDTIPHSENSPINLYFDSDSDDEDQRAEAVDNALPSSTVAAVKSAKLQPHDPSTWPEHLASSDTVVAFILAVGPLPRADSFANFNFPKTNERSFSTSALT